MRRAMHAPAEVAWEIVTDLRGHDRWIPFTKVDAAASPPRPGDAVVAVTAGLFEDRMTVVTVRPPVPPRPRDEEGQLLKAPSDNSPDVDPGDDVTAEADSDPEVPPIAQGAHAGLLRVRKDGPILLGDVHILVAPTGPSSCVVVWREDVHLRGPLPDRLTAALLKPVLKGMTSLALRRIDRYLTHGRS